MPATPEETPSKSNMPLYLDEEQIARAVLGSKRARLWRIRPAFGGASRGSAQGCGSSRLRRVEPAHARFPGAGAALSDPR